MDFTFPNGGMFGIKLVAETQPTLGFFGIDGNPTLMNFPDNPKGRRLAALVPIGHKSLVYLMAPAKRIWAAIEYIKWDSKIADPLKEGVEAARAQGADTKMEAINSHYARVWRCVRVLRMIPNYKEGPLQDFSFHEGDIMFDMPQRDYLDLFSTIPWTWPKDA